MKPNKVLLLSTMLLLSIVLSACGSGSGNDIVGTWTITEYDNGEEIFPADEIATLYGETAGEFNKLSMIFTSSGNVTLTRPDMQGGTSDLKLAYSVQDGYVEVYDPDNTSNFELYEYQDNEIRIEVSSGLTAIFEKQ